MWSLENLTLNGNLPIDLIELLHVSKTGRGNNHLQLSGAGYFKAMSDGTLQSKVIAEFKMAQELNIVVLQQRVQTLQNNKPSLMDAAKQIMEDRRPIELELKEKRKQLNALEMYTNQYSNNKIGPLCSLKQGTYAIKALKECKNSTETNLY